MSSDIGCRGDCDLELLWLWCRPAAVALIGPLAWEFPCAVGVALIKKIKKKKRSNQSIMDWSLSLMSDNYYGPLPKWFSK